MVTHFQHKKSEIHFFERHQGVDVDFTFNKVMTRNLKELVSKLTLDEKASILGGRDVWHTQGVPRLDIPEIMVADGPHGLRQQTEEQANSGTLEAKQSICFPPACASSCTFNPELLYKMGQVIGDECASQDVHILLGPAINIKRTPFCGRNFEYFSEDPYLTHKLAAGLVKGVQSKCVGTCLKHFACNNQESRRLQINEIIDDRALREIYLRVYEGTINEAQPWTMMCSYNQINGVYSADNHWLLTEVLRDQWGFEGFVMSDWGAVNERVTDVIAGVELQMPGPCLYDNASIAKAVREGKLDEKIVDNAVERILRIVFKAHDGKQKGNFDKEAHHQISREVCEETSVLLKNEENILPLKKDQKIAFIGEFAQNPRYQGGGSSHINSYKVENALDASKAYCNVTYAKGYNTDKDEVDSTLEAEAIKVAQAADVAVLFVGLPDDFETEGFDRTHLNMPNCQNHLIEEIIKVNKNIVVVLHNGSTIFMPWINGVKGILEAYLGGEAVGAVVADILLGKVNPSGRLAETFPLRVEDTPSYIDFPGHDDLVEYKEGIFVGYRYYDLRNIPVLFPFGHGLSYTTFEYSNLKFSNTKFEDNEGVKVSVDVKNTGSVFGKDVIQLYVSDKTDAALRPIRELKGFSRVALNPGETKTVTIELDKRAFQWWNPKINGWYAKSGDYEIQIAKSSRNIVLTGVVNMISTTQLPFEVHLNSVFNDLWKNPITKHVIDGLLERYPEQKQIVMAPKPGQEFTQGCIINGPLRCLNLFFPFDKDVIYQLIDDCHKAIQATK